MLSGLGTMIPLALNTLPFFRTNCPAHGALTWRRLRFNSETGGHSDVHCITDQLSQPVEMIGIVRNVILRNWVIDAAFLECILEKCGYFRVVHNVNGIISWFKIRQPDRRFDALVTVFMIVYEKR
jgi:hypothetical protein